MNTWIHSCLQESRFWHIQRAAFMVHRDWVPDASKHYWAHLDPHMSLPHRSHGRLDMACDLHALFLGDRIGALLLPCFRHAIENCASHQLHPVPQERLSKTYWSGLLHWWQRLRNFSRYLWGVWGALRLIICPAKRHKFNNFVFRDSTIIRSVDSDGNFRAAHLRQSPRFAHFQKCRIQPETVHFDKRVT